MTTCWPQIFESCSVTTRATMSVGPPAANGTTKRTTRLGQSSDCLCTHAARPLRLSAKRDPAEREIGRRRVSTRSPWLRLSYPSREHLRTSGAKKGRSLTERPSSAGRIVPNHTSAAHSYPRSYLRTCRREYQRSEIVSCSGGDTQTKIKQAILRCSGTNRTRKAAFAAMHGPKLLYLGPSSLALG